MISMTSISSAGGAAKYMTEQHAVEYYADSQVQSQWKGQGAEIQGLAGLEVTTKDLTQQLEGKVTEFNKESGEFEEKQLGVMRGGELQHRCGWDLTFAAPKSVSIESEVFARDDVRSAHESAVAKAMEWLEEKAAQTRVDGEFVKTGNLTYATFEHATSRAGDPQTHTHVIVSNVTYVDGKAYSLSNEKLMDYRATCDQVYKNELANELGKLGYEVEWDKKGNFEIVGHSKENLETFSKRNEQIKEALAERGMDKDTASHSARQSATLATRQDKDHPESALAHREKWQQEAEAAGVKAAERQSIKEPVSHEQRMQAARDAVSSAINHLTEREQAFTDRELWKESAKFAQGHTDTDKIASAIGELKQKGELIERDDGKFTTKTAVEAEKAMTVKLVSGINAHEQVVSVKEFTEELRKFEAAKNQELGITTFRLSDEQVEACFKILCGNHGNSGLQGLAGTGKTTAFEFVKQVCDAYGWQVIGISNGGAQAEKLERETTIKGMTNAQFIIDTNKLIKDADLAGRAVETYERNIGPFGKTPDWSALDKQVKTGEAIREFDSANRMYVTDKDGNTWHKGLYESVRTFEASNLEHLGLTNTTYVITEKGVFKSGGNLQSELAGTLKDKLNESHVDAVKAKYEGRDLSDKEKGQMRVEINEAKDKDRNFLRHLGEKALKAIPNHILTKAQQWERCNPNEAGAARLYAFNESAANKEKLTSELREQSTSVFNGNQKILLVHDEAGQASMQEGVGIVRAAEAIGAKTIHAGDIYQLQSVAAGKWFEQAVQNMPMSYMSDIQRQQTEHMKESVKSVLAGEISASRNHIETKEFSPNQDAVRDAFMKIEHPSKAEKDAYKRDLKEAEKLDNKVVIKELAKDYANLPLKTNKFDVSKLDQKVEGQDYIVTKRDSQDRVDRIQFLKDDKELGVKAGQEGTIPTLPNTNNMVKSNEVIMDSRENSLITTTSNIDRNSINSSIREILKEKGDLQDGLRINTLEKTGLTQEEQSRAINYDKGMTVQFDRDYRSQGFEAGMMGTVSGVDNRTNTVELKMDDGRTLSFNPAKTEGQTLYNRVEKEFSVGEKVAFTQNDKTLGVLNNQQGTIEKIEGSVVTIKLDAQKEVDGVKQDQFRTIDVEKYSSIDYAYGKTVHKQQGQSEGKNFEHENTASAGHGDRSKYVDDTRAKYHTISYTQNSLKADKQNATEMNKESAMSKDDFEKYSKSVMEEMGKSTTSDLSYKETLERMEGKVVDQSQSAAIEAKPEQSVQAAPEKTGEREERQPAQEKATPELEQAVQTAEQSLPEVTVRASAEQITERDLELALGVNEAIQVSDAAWHRAADMMDRGMTAEEIQLSKQLDVEGHIAASDDLLKNADQRLLEEVINHVEKDIPELTRETAPEQTSEAVKEQPSAEVAATPETTSEKTEERSADATQQEAEKAEKSEGRDPIQIQEADTDKVREAAPEQVAETEKSGDQREVQQDQVRDSAEQVSEPARSQEAVAEQGAERGAEPTQDRSVEAEPEKVREAGQEQTAEKASGDQQDVQHDQLRDTAEHVSEPARSQESASERVDEVQSQPREVEPEKALEATSEQSTEASKDQPAVEVVAAPEKAEERASEAGQTIETQEGREPAQTAAVEANVAAEQGSDTSIVAASAYVAERLNEWLSDKTEDKSADKSIEQDKSQSRDGAENQISGSVKAKDASGQEFKDESNKSTEKTEGKSQSKEEGKVAKQEKQAARQEREIDFGR